MYIYSIIISISAVVIVVSISHITNSIIIGISMIVIVISISLMINSTIAVLVLLFSSLLLGWACRRRPCGRGALCDPPALFATDNSF